MFTGIGSCDCNEKKWWGLCGVFGAEEKRGISAWNSNVYFASLHCGWPNWLNCCDTWIIVFPSHIGCGMNLSLKDPVSFKKNWKWSLFTSFHWSATTEPLVATAAAETRPNLEIQRSSRGANVLKSGFRTSLWITSKVDTYVSASAVRTAGWLEQQEARRSRVYLQNKRLDMRR